MNKKWFSPLQSVLCRLNPYICYKKDWCPSDILSHQWVLDRQESIVQLKLNYKKLKFDMCLSVRRYNTRHKVSNLPPPRPHRETLLCKILKFSSRSPKGVIPASNALLSESAFYCAQMFANVSPCSRRLRSRCVNHGKAGFQREELTFNFNSIIYLNCLYLITRYQREEKRGMSTFWPLVSLAEESNALYHLRSSGVQVVQVITTTHVSEFSPRSPKTHHPHCKLTGLGSFSDVCFSQYWLRWTLAHLSFIYY